jgi:hypothetical protein
VSELFALEADAAPPIPEASVTPGRLGAALDLGSLSRAAS